MNAGTAKDVLGVLLLVGAVQCLLVGHGMSGSGLDTHAGWFGILMMIGGVVLAFLGLVFLFARSVTNVMQSVEAIACVIIGASVIWYAASGLMHSKGREASTSPMEKPPPSRVQLLFYGGCGLGLVLFFGGRLVRTEDREGAEDDRPSAASGSGSDVDPGASPRRGRK